MAEISEKALTLLTTKGFDNEFFNNLSKCNTHKEAYEMTEKIYHDAFGRNKYANFESYKNSRNIRLKAK